MYKDSLNKLETKDELICSKTQSLDRLKIEKDIINELQSETTILKK